MAQFDTKEIVIGGTEWKTAPFRFSRMFTLAGGSGGSYIDVLLSGVSPLALTNVLGLNYIKALGATEQNGTPSPDTPIDIICNNGVVKVSKNLFDKNQTYSYTSAARYWSISVPNGIYTCSTNIPRQNVNIANAWFDNINNFSSSINPVANNEPRTITVTNGVLYFGIRHEGPDYLTYYNNLINGTYWVQIEQGSTATPYHPYDEIYTDGTVETVEVDTTGDTATAEMLLKVGDYKDVQEVLNGNVTRNVGIKVLDGTESWQLDAYTGGFMLANSFNNLAQIPNNYVGYSNCYTIIAISSSIQSQLQNNQCGWNTTQVFCLRDDRYTTVEQFKQYLADQYTNGTPVIIVYPLATPTTETVTGQSLSVSGNCTVTATGSLDNLELELSYKQSI